MFYRYRIFFHYGFCLSFLFLESILLYGHQRKYPVYDSNISVEKYFRYAQDQRNMRYYSIALAYYDIIIVNFSDDQRRVVTAEYEKGYIYYITGRFSKSLEMFDRVLIKAENSVLSPHVPKPVFQLARDLKKKIEEKTHSKKAKKYHDK